MLRVRLFSGFCELYCRSLQQHSLATKAITTAAVAGASDIACQSIEQHPGLLLWPQEFLQQLSWPYNAADEQHRSLVTTALPSSTNASVVMANSSSSTIHYNWNRTLQVCIVGLCWAGPAQHTWYNILERVVRIQHRVGGLVTRVALDSIMYTPFGLAGYFTCRSLLEGRNVKGVVAKLQDKWQSTLFTSWHFWPAANIINFSMVPLQFRVLYWSVLSFFWQGYLTQTNEMST